MSSTVHSVQLLCNACNDIVRPYVYGIRFDFDNWEKSAKEYVQVATASAGIAMISIVVVYWRHFHIGSIPIVVAQVAY